MVKGYSKKRCDECGAYMTKGFRIYKGKFLCFKCYSKKGNIINISNSFNKKLKEVLEKIYLVEPYIYKNTLRTRPIYFPNCMIGKKFKIILIDDEQRNTKINGREEQSK